MQGGDFLSGAAGGFFGSLGASGFGAVAGEWGSSFGGNVFFGVLSGGIGAELTGGNFWVGAVTGGIVAGLNHAMHMEKTANGYDKNGKKINDNGGDNIDYKYDDIGNIISSTEVNVIRTGTFGQDLDVYGIRVYNIKSGGLYDPSFDMFINYVGGKVLGSVLGNVSNKVISFIGKYIGGTKQWIRTGSSYSVKGGFKTYSTRWGAGGNYWKKIGNPTLQNWNKSLRNTKIPGNSWRVQDKRSFSLVEKINNMSL